MAWRCRGRCPHRPAWTHHGDARGNDNHHACHSEPVRTPARNPHPHRQGVMHGMASGERIAAPVCGLVRNDMIDGFPFHPNLLFAAVPACGSMWPRIFPRGLPRVRSFHTRLASTPTKESATPCSTKNLHPLHAKKRRLAPSLFYSSLFVSVIPPPVLAGRWGS